MLRRGRLRTDGGVEFEDFAADAQRLSREAEANIVIARRRARQRIRAHMLTTIAAQYPAQVIQDEKDIEALKAIFYSVQVAGHRPRLTLSAAIYVYGTAKMGEVADWDAATADAYDPAADVGWPS